MGLQCVRRSTVHCWIPHPREELIIQSPVILHSKPPPPSPSHIFGVGQATDNLIRALHTIYILAVLLLQHANDTSEVRYCIRWSVSLFDNVLVGCSCTPHYQDMYYALLLIHYIHILNLATTAYIHTALQVAWQFFCGHSNFGQTNERREQLHH